MANVRWKIHIAVAVSIMIGELVPLVGLLSIITFSCKMIWSLFKFIFFLDTVQFSTF